MTKNIKLLYVLIAILIVSNVTLMIFLFKNNNIQYNGKTNKIESNSDIKGIQEENKPKYTRDEFRNLIVGKTQKEILEILGKPPNSTQDYGDDVNWYYYNTTYDPITGTSSGAQVRFKNGICEEINFN